jgi:anti-sigma regulatory factor (Ser/Thr protein kinase)
LRSVGADDADYVGPELIFGELLANVVQHAPGEITVCVHWPKGDVPVLTVYDRGPGFQLIPQLPADPFADAGRGLFLVKTLGDDLRVYRHRGGGMCVRVRLRLFRPAAPA